MDVPSETSGPPNPPSESTPTVEVYMASHRALQRSQRGSLVDRGANGGILGDDARVILQHTREVDVTGIDNHQIPALKLVDASARVETNKGPAILIMRQYAYHGRGRTIHSSGQIEWNKNTVDDRSIACNGRQIIKVLDGYILPLDIINGLPYLHMVPNTDAEFDTLPHIVLTSSAKWNPRCLDHILSERPDWTNVVKDLDEGLITKDTPFDQYGNYKERYLPDATRKLPSPDKEAQVADSSPIEDDDSVDSNASPTDPYEEFHVAFHSCCNLNQIYVYDANLDDSSSELESTDDLDDTTSDSKTKLEVVAPTLKAKRIDYKKLRPYFLMVPDEKIRRTFDATTQFATNVMSGAHIKQTIKSPYPMMNVLRRNEPVATDTVYSETPAVCGGQTMAQIFVGRKSLVIDVYGMSTEKEFVNTFDDVIRKRGAPDKLLSDSASVEISRKVQDILRALCIDDWQSEPNYQHQNPAEHRWQHLKRNVQWFMNYRNVDPSAWLLCMQWVADVMNMTAEKSLGWQPPLQRLTGQMIDISIALIFLFWDVVYVSRYDDDDYRGQVGSQKSSEIRGRFVGFAWNVGHALTFKVLTDDSKRIVPRSRLRLARTGENNLKLDIEAGDVPQRVYIKSKRDAEGDNVQLPTIDLRQNPFNINFDDKDNEADTQEQGETTNPKPPVVETVEDLLDDPPSPMDSPLLKDLPTIDEPEDSDFIAPHHKVRKPGEPNPNKDTVEFVTDSLKTNNPTISGLLPEEMIDRTFLMPPNEDGSRFRAKIIERVDDHKREMNSDPDVIADLIRFKCIVNDDYEELVDYNDIVDFIEQDQTWEGVWKFKRILDHVGPLTAAKHSAGKDGEKWHYQGSSYNVQVEWETGEIDWRPLYTPRTKVGVWHTDPVTVAIYASQNGLLDKPGWKLPGLKRLAKTQKRLVRIANQAKLQSFRNKPIYMYGF